MFLRSTSRPAPRTRQLRHAGTAVLAASAGIAVLAASAGVAVLATAMPAVASPIGATGIVQQVVVEKTDGGDDHLTLLVDASGAHPVTGLESVPTGSRVRTTLGPALSATGERPVRSFSVVSTAPTAAQAPAAAAAEPYAAKPVIVVPVRWTGTEPDKTGQAVADIVNGAANSYWKDVSGGRIGFKVSKVVPTLTLSGSYCTAAGGVSSAALEQIHAAAGVRVGATGGAHVLAYSKSAGGNCTWAGLATVSNNNPGAGGWVVVNGVARLDVIGHELGHNLGLGHSNLRWCADSTGARFADGATGCTRQSYRDPYDIMGIAWGTSGYLNAAQRDQLGLLSPGGITDLSSGQATLAPLGGGSGVRAARVADGTARYWLEYRTKTGRDSWIDGSPSTSGYAIPGSGVVVHRADTLKAGGGTDLIDGHPVGAKLDRAALRTGEKWTSPSGKVTVTVVSTSATGAVVRVSGATPGPFSLTGAPTAASAQGIVQRTSDVTVNWTASQDTGNGIVRYEVLSGATVLGTTVPEARSATVTVAPGTHTITVRAVDGKGLTRTSSNSMRFVVDPDAPVVSAARTVFRSGTAGTTLPVTTAWAAADPTSGICTQQFSGAAGTSHDFPATARAAADAVPAGLSTWGVTATDCAGNAVTVQGSVDAAVLQESALRYTSTWPVGRSAAAHGGTIRSTAKAGATASTSLSTRAVALVATRAKDQGSVRVHVDGKLVATVNLYAAKGVARQVVWTYAWPTAGTHTVKITNVGVKARPRANVDALLSLR